VLVRFETIEAGFEQERRRPAVIIASEESIRVLPNVPIVPLIAASENRTPHKHDVEILQHTAAGKLAGLRMDCVATCSLVYSYPKTWFSAKIGKLPPETTDEICRQVRELIGLSDRPREPATEGA
jgi:mRNA-degrading endonuclease toxin of MazEF toxin-antitoxin module